MVEVVAVEIIDDHVQGARPYERVDILILVVKDIHHGHGLVGVVAAHDALPGLGIIRFAYTGKEQQAHIVEGEGA